MKGIIVPGWLADTLDLAGENLTALTNPEKISSILSDADVVKYILVQHICAQQTESVDNFHIDYLLGPFARDLVAGWLPEISSKVANGIEVEYDGMRSSGYRSMLVRLLDISLEDRLSVEVKHIDQDTVAVIVRKDECCEPIAPRALIVFKETLLLMYNNMMHSDVFNSNLFASYLRLLKRV